MPITSLPIGNGFYRARSLPVSAQQCMNWYVSIPSAPSLSETQLYGSPGMSQVATSGEGANRGARVMAGIPYFVNGSNLYRLNSDHTLDDLGTISGTGRVSMSDNGTQLCILVPGGAGYIFTEPSTLTAISDLDFTTNGNPQQVTFVDGYFVFTTDAKKFILSAINDGTDYNAIDYGTAESSPDATVTPVVFKNQLFIVGETTTEAFSNIGGADFPFQRSGLFLDEGTVAPFSVVNGSETFAFIGGGKSETPGVYALNGNTTQKISTDAIDELLQGLTTAELAAVYGWSYAQSGHFFIGWTLPTTAIVFDTTTGIWAERASRYIDENDDTIDITYRATCFVQAYGNLYVGDTQDGRIGLLSMDTYTEYGEAVHRVMSTQPFQNNMQPYFVPYLELTMESGVGNEAEPDPMIIMDRSLNGGKSFTYVRERPIGKEGEYNRRAIWRRLGRVSRFDVYRFTLSEPVKPVIIALTAQLVGVENAQA